MRLLVMICACALIAFGCAKVPSQQSYPYSYQHKMQSADHWEKLAKKIVSKQIHPFFTNKPDSILGVYIDDKDGSTFGTAFQTYLTTELFNKSIPVSKISQNAVVIEWSVQKVIHNSLRRNPGPPAGIFGAIAYGVGSLFGGDYYHYGDVPKTELLITIKLHSDNVIYSRTTETIYINDEDTYNYWVLPENGRGTVNSFVREGAIVCREPTDLSIMLDYDLKKNLNLNKFIEEGKCAIMKKAYPVTILEERENYLIIRSSEKPYGVYVTVKDSIGG